MKRVRLTGLSAKGKNRVAQWGPIWRVDERWSREDRWLLHTQNGQSWRWVFVKNDPDFLMQLLTEEASDAN